MLDISARLFERLTVQGQSVARGYIQRSFARMTDYYVHNRYTVAAVGSTADQRIVIIAGLVVPLVGNSPIHTVASRCIYQRTCYRLNLYAQYMYTVTARIGGVMQRIRTRSLVPQALVLYRVTSCQSLIRCFCHARINITPAKVQRYDTVATDSRCQSSCVYTGTLYRFATCPRQRICVCGITAIRLAYRIEQLGTNRLMDDQRHRNHAVATGSRREDVRMNGTLRE